ncbi:MAG: dicarboxylate/amino acid:cation symporter, partial [Firmicutes bacterium]|nr:dicarboxylate/amino acid:cation symporter [Bacillota bacterium]
MRLTTKILIGLALGIIVGLMLGGSPHIATDYILPFGTLFLRMIKMIIVPLVLSSLVVGAASMGDVKKLGRIGGKTIVFYLATTAIAIIIGLILGNIMQPGAGLSIPVDAAVEAAEAPSIANTLLNIIPDNALSGLVSANMLQTIAFAIFLGIGITLIGEKGKPFLNFFESMAEVMYKIVAIIMSYAPIGVFALITPVAAQNGPAVLLPLLKVVLGVYIGCFLHAVLVYSSLVKVFAKMNPLTFFKGAAPASMVAFSTCSSSGTLPVTIKSTQD